MEFTGEISASKSILNRLLIVSSYYPNLSFSSVSKAEDVQNLKNALDEFNKGEKEFICGDGGTTIRFLLGRLSRSPGEFTVRASERLLARPHGELIRILSTVNTEVFLDKNFFKVKSLGWPLRPIEFFVDGSESSQFASSLLLNSLNFNYPIQIQMSDSIVSKEYLLMTIKLIQSLGLNINYHEGKNLIVLIPSTSPKLKKMDVEADSSSVVTLCAFAAIDGYLEIKNCFQNSIQPDNKFINELSKIGPSINWSKGHLVFSGVQELKACDFDLEQNPDVFPVLSILLTRANGISKLSGLHNLDLKESPRFKNILKLLKLLNIEFENTKHELKIYGNAQKVWKNIEFSFDPDHDHRMAMAAALVNHWGGRINILNKSCVNKSFPEFWDVV